RGQTSTREAADAVGRRADSFVTEENRRSRVMFPTMQNDLTTADKSDILTRFMALFAGDEKNYGQYDPTRAKPKAEKSKLEVGHCASTQHNGLTAKHWDEHLAGIKVLGVIPNRSDNTCLWGCIDSDIDIPNCLEVAAQIQKCGFPASVVRSKS